MASDDAELRRFEALKQKYQTTLAEFDIDDELIEGTFAKDIVPDKWADEGLEPTIMPTAYDAVENAVDHILTTPRISVPTRPVFKDRETARQIAENTRYFLQHCWDKFAIEQGNVLRTGVKSLIKGKIVLKFEIDWDAIPTPPDTDGMSTRAKNAAIRKFNSQLERLSKSKFIFKLSALPKETVFEDPTQPWNPRYAYETYKITAEDALEKFGDVELPDGRNFKELYEGGDAYRELDFIQLYEKPHKGSKGKYICWIENERVHDTDNPYCFETDMHDPEGDADYDGFIPYFIGDPGWGSESADNDPKDRYKSILRPLRSLLEAETRQITEVEAWLRLYMWKPVIGTNLPEVKEGEDELPLGPGAFWNINKEAGQAVDVLQFGEAPVTVFQFLGKVQSAANQSSKFGALGGIPQEGVGTATEADGLNRNAATKLSGPISTLRRIIIQINTALLMCVDKILEAPITVTGAFNTGPAEVTLKPGDVDGFYVSSVELDTSDKELLDARKARLAADLYRIFTGLSERTALGMAGFDDATGEQDERASEDLMKSPQMQQVELLLAMTGLGEVAEPVKAAFMSMMSQANGAQGGGGSGDASAVTNVDDQGNPQAVVPSQARADFVQGDQAESAYR